MKIYFLKKNLFKNLKKEIYNFYLFLLHLLILLCCTLNLSKFCAILIKVSLFQPKPFRKKNKSKKILIVLDRVTGGGRRDFEITNKSSSLIPQIFFIRRTIIKIIFYYFVDKSKLFKNLKLNYNELDNKPKYFELSEIIRNKLVLFWTDVIKHLKKLYKDNEEINFIALAYYYNTEFALYIGCKNNKVPVKLWNKECFMSDPHVRYRIKSNEYKKVFQYFDQISVYNSFMKKMLIKMDNLNKKKISVNGCPRINDFINKKKKIKKIKNLLFLTFNSITGIPQTKENRNLNWNLSHNKVIKILNNLSDRKDINVIIKRKNHNSFKTPVNISKNIKIFEGGSAEKLINQADIIIGHNSGSTIESMANGKYVMVPFFEKKLLLKKYLYRFNKNLIYLSEQKMKKKIIKLIGKKVVFPIENKDNKKTVKYFLGNSKFTLDKCANFLNK